MRMDVVRFPNWQIRLLTSDSDYSTAASSKRPDTKLDSGFANPQHRDNLRSIIFVEHEVSRSDEGTMRAAMKQTLLPMLLAIAFLVPGSAESRGLVVITHGEDITEIGEVVDEHKEAIKAELGGDAKIGFIHEAFGVFWLNIWTWDGQNCIYLNDQYWEVEPEQAATLLGQPDSTLRNPVFYTFPPGLLVLIAIVAIFIPYKVVSSRNENRVKKLFDDPRYQQALKMLASKANATEESGEAPQGNNGFEESVTYLRGEGIDAEEARTNLKLLIDTIVAHQQQVA